MLLQLILYMRVNDKRGYGILEKRPFEFKRGHSLNQQVLQLVEHATEDVNHNIVTSYVFFDEAKKWNDVWHEKPKFQQEPLPQQHLHNWCFKNNYCHSCTVRSWHYHQDIPTNKQDTPNCNGQDIRLVQEVEIRHHWEKSSAPIIVKKRGNNISYNNEIIVSRRLHGRQKSITSEWPFTGS